MKKRSLLVALSLALCVVFTASACGSNPQPSGSDSTSGHPEGFVNYVDKALINEKSSLTTYEGKNFLDDGIGKVTLYNAIDGDTAHFYQKETDGRDERYVKVRFYGIDTPESAGKVQPWGQKASNFTKGKLKNAKTIVLTKETLVESAAEVDSTGGRFKALVWVSDKENAELSDLRCLNLWIVQEGFSNSKGTVDCPIGQEFRDADLQAQNLKLNIWSGDDPDFYRGPATQTSIKEVVEDFAANNGKSKFDGTKVQLTGIVFKVIGENAYVIEDFEDEETGEVTRYGLYVFTQYKSYEPLKTIGNKLNLIGRLEIRFGSPQLSDVNYSEYLPDPDNDMTIIDTGIEKPVDEMKITDVDNKRETINTVGLFKNLHATGRGWNAKDKTTQKPSGAMNIEVADEANNKIMLRVPKDVFLLKKDGGSLDRVTDYKYLSEGGFHFDLIAAVAIFEPQANEDETNEAGDKAYWQLQLCNKKDIIYL